MYLQIKVQVVHEPDASDTCICSINSADAMELSLALLNFWATPLKLPNVAFAGLNASREFESTLRNMLVQTALKPLSAR